MRPRDAVERRVRRRADSRQTLTRNIEDPEQLVVPVERAQIHQHRAARVGDVGHERAAVGAARQIPDHPGVDGSEHRLAARNRVANARHGLEDPLQLAPREVRRRWQPGLLSDRRTRRRAIERADDAIGAGVLPDDGVVPGTTGLGIPDHGRLALVGDADRGQVAGPEPRVPERAGNHGVGAFRDLERVMFDPAGLRHDLLVLELMPRDLVTTAIEHHEPRAGRTLIERTYKVGHGISSRVASGFSRKSELLAKGAFRLKLAKRCLPAKAGSYKQAHVRIRQPRKAGLPPLRRRSARRSESTRSSSRSRACRGSAGARARGAGQDRAPG